MTLEEYILKAEEVAKTAESDAEWGVGNYFIDRGEVLARLEYAEECRNLVDWLKDYKRLLEQKPKTGRWEWVQYDSNPNIGNWHCSECRTIIPHMPEETDNTPIYKWCPVCGAKMEVEHE